MAGEPTLGAGDTGDWVSYLQQVLEYLGHGSGFTAGVFDDTTATAVRTAQQAYSLPVSGTCDDPTWTALSGASTQPANGPGVADTTVPDDIAFSAQDEFDASGDEVALTALDDLPGHVQAVC